MTLHITEHRDGFAPGYTDVAEHETLELGVLRLEPGSRHVDNATRESAWLLMDGRIRGEIDGVPFALARSSLFDESASCIHVAAGAEVVIEAETDSELTVYRCGNTKRFPARVFSPDMVPNEHRGKGQVAGRCLRFVRTIFDGTTSPPEAELVLGEVVTLPGGWSSYPPHHHSQPEIYHYRFTAPEGFGHAELGDDVVKVRHNDTVRIPPGQDHAQCTAPGYGMYYAWVIRHLPDDPYTVPDFTAAHAWTMDRDADFWWPEGIARGDD